MRPQGLLTRTRGDAGGAFPSPCIEAETLPLIAGVWGVSRIEKRILHGEYLAFLKQPLAVEEYVLGGARGPPGDRSPYDSKFYSEFAGILQV